MQPAGYGRWQQVWGAVLTSVPQVPSALNKWLAVEHIQDLPPVSFALAGGAMLALVVVDLLPDAWKHASHQCVVAGTVVGGLRSAAPPRSRSAPRPAAGGWRLDHHADRGPAHLPRAPCRWAL